MFYKIFEDELGSIPQGCKLVIKNHVEKVVLGKDKLSAAYFLCGFMNCTMQKAFLYIDNLKIDKDIHYKELIDSGRYIQAIKEYRENTNTDLRESKDYIDNLKNRVIEEPVIYDALPDELWEI